jgi:cytochrome c553
MVSTSRNLLASAIGTCCLLLLAFGSASSAQETANDAVVPFVLPESGPFKPEDIKIDNQKAISDWYRSAHADQAAEAFSRWDSDEGIRPACAVCHSAKGSGAITALMDRSPESRKNPSPQVVWSIAEPATMKGSAISRKSFSQVEFTIRSSVLKPLA